VWTLLHAPQASFQKIPATAFQRSDNDPSYRVDNEPGFTRQQYLSLWSNIFIQWSGLGRKVGVRSSFYKGLSAAFYHQYFSYSFYQQKYSNDVLHVEVFRILIGRFVGIAQALQKIRE
jgi:hypothetical protein